MKLCVVGHGPSLEGAGLGHLIDHCDAVLRFKKGWKLTQDYQTDYGKRTDYLCASTEVPGTLLVPDDIKAQIKAFVGYPKYGFYNEHAVESMQTALERDIVVPINLCNYWNDRFRKLGGTHPNVSVGMAGLIVLAHELRPQEVVLAGMDAILNPAGGFKRIDTVPRTGAGVFPDHDWWIERALLDALATEYEFTYRNILDDDDSRSRLQRTG